MLTGANAVKHPGSNRVKIEVERQGPRLELTLRDFGQGFDPGEIEDWALTGEHFGLVSIKERLEGLGAELQIHSTVGQGTLLKAGIPIPDETRGGEQDVQSF